MPIYNFECQNCHNISEAIVNASETYTICPKCGSDAQKIFTGTRFTTFKPYMEYNLGDFPVEITSKKQLDNELKKRGLAMDNRPLGLKNTRRRRFELKEKAKKAKEILNAT